MLNFSLYNLKDYSLFEHILLKELLKTKFVLICIGTKSYLNDDFGVIIGEKLKKIKVISFGGLKREINGLNFKQVYSFVKQKLPDFKVVIIDSVFVKNNNKPCLIFKKSGVNVSGINSTELIGDYGILFNSFSYSNNTKDMVVNLLFNTFNKLCQNN